MELRRCLIVLTSVVGLGCLAGCSGATSTSTTSPSTTPTSPTPVPPSAFVGLWQNVDSSTDDNSQLQIRIDGSTIHVHGYGACGATPLCDWGEAPAPVANAATGTFTVTWVRVAGTGSAITYQMTLTVPGGDGLLRTTMAAHFSDGTQPDHSILQSFRKGS